MASIYAGDLTSISLGPQCLVQLPEPQLPRKVRENFQDSKYVIALSATTLELRDLSHTTLKHSLLADNRFSWNPNPFSF